MTNIYVIIINRKKYSCACAKFAGKGAGLHSRKHLTTEGAKMERRKIVFLLLTCAAMFEACKGKHTYVRTFFDHHTVMPASYEAEYADTPTFFNHYNYSLFITRRHGRQQFLRCCRLLGLLCDRRVDYLPVGIWMLL